MGRSRLEHTPVVGKIPLFVFGKGVGNPRVVVICFLYIVNLVEVGVEGLTKASFFVAEFLTETWSMKRG